MTGRRLASAALLAAPVAVCEEAVFRGLLMPRRVSTSADRRQAAGALAAFVGWHLLQGVVWPPARRVFWRADFLAAAVLGAACAALKLRTGSIWPGVTLHFGVIVIWRACLSGRNFREGGEAMTRRTLPG